MTSKEKAEQLVGRYYFQVETLEQQKQCALIAVDEIIKAIDFDWMEVQNLESVHRYWQEVKQEIEGGDK
jgi:hypothetical protein